MRVVPGNCGSVSKASVPASLPSISICTQRVVQLRQVTALRVAGTAAKDTSDRAVKEKKIVACILAYYKTGLLKTSEEKRASDGCLLP